MFNEACEFVKTVSCDNATKLRLYSLFKLTTEEAPGPSGKRPGMFDLTGRAKYDAYKALSESEPYVSLGVDERQAQAREDYLAEARKLGFGGTSEKKRHVNTGMVSVSTMATEDAGDTAEKFPLQAAALDNDIQLIQEIVAKNASALNSLDNFGFTALHLASDRANTEAVRQLLSLGADAAIKDSDGNTALDLAREAENVDIISLLDHL